MGNSPRYQVQTRYGWFSLDEGSYRDYLAGKLQWIDWPPQREAAESARQDAPPPHISKKAIELRDRAARSSLLEMMKDFAVFPPVPCKERMYGLSVYELNLSVRASNGLMRAGVQTFGRLDQLMQSEGGIRSVRNLGEKSVKEIREAFLVECYTRLLPYEKAEFWQEVLELNLSGLSDII